MTENKSKADKYLNDVFKAVENQRKSQGATVTDGRLEEALCYRDALKTINAGEATAVQARLIAMWWLYRHVELAGEYNEFNEFVEQEILTGQDIDKSVIQRASSIIQHIIQWTHTNPVQHDDGFITADNLLHSPGLWAKMKEVVGLFIKASDKHRIRLIIAIYTMSLSNLRDEKRKIQLESAGIDDGEIGSDGEVDPTDEDSIDSTTAHTSQITVQRMRLANDRVRFIFPESIDATTAATIEMFLDGLCRFESVDVAHA
jgi:hypothetical protein